LLESIYKFLLNILLTQLGRIALPFYAYVFSLFFFICYCNLIGIMPFSYTVTSHIIATFTFGFSVLMSLILIGFSYQKLKFLNLFIPKNIPV
jgi:F-type H+-transporting ATPase subunit a